MASLSDTPRRLGSESGRLRRAARRIERAGGNPTRFLEEAERVKLGERSITSADSNIAEHKLNERMNRGLLEVQRRSLLGGGTTPNTTAAPAGTPQSAPTPGLVRPPTTGAPSPRVAGGTQPPAAATPRPSLINGRPAGDVLSSMRSSPSPVNQTFGSDVARRNIESGGIDSAIADYQRRAALQDAPAPTPQPQEPGNRSEVVAGLGIPGVSEVASLAGRKSTPLQDAITAARARRVATEPVLPPEPATPDSRPLTVGGVEVRDTSPLFPRDSSAPRSAATPPLVTPPSAEAVLPETRQSRSTPQVSFQPVDQTQTESALLNRRQQQSNAVAREQMGRNATIPSWMEGTKAGGLLRFLSKPRL